MTGADSGQASTRKSGGSRFRRDIEGMRALAVMLVLLYHAGVPGLPGGFAGVDVFFVVSGFVITTQLLNELARQGRVHLMGFYARRAKRLLPAAATVLVVTSLAAWLMVSRVQWAVIAGDVVGSAAYVVNWVFAARTVDYLAEVVEPSPVLHYWSLAVEEQFYLVWPIIIIGLAWLVRRRTQREVTPGRGLLALGLTLLVVVPSLGWAFWSTATNPSQAFFFTTTRLWELGLGALVALVASRCQRLRPGVAVTAGWIGLAMVVVAALVQDGSTPWPAPGALVPTLGTVLVIIGGFNAGRYGPALLLGHAFPVWIGGLSYSLYLWHWPVLRIASWQFGELTLAQSLVCVLLAVIPAWVGYRLIENPIRYSHTLRKSPRFALSVGANCTLVALLAGLLLGAAGGVAGKGAPPSGARGDLVPSLSELDPPESPGEDAVNAPPLFDVVTPDPALAVEDVPELYEEGCQVAPASSEPVPCEAGDPDGHLLVAIVGDSKIAQWEPAIDEIAKQRGWRIVSHTKSACSPTAATTWSQGERYQACTDWGEAVLDQLLAGDVPDVVITSGRREEAGDDPHDLGAEALVDGYATYWQRLVDQGIRVVVLSDTPAPVLGGLPAYECVAENPDDFEAACSWPYQPSQGSQILRSATERVDQAAYVDLDPWVCPSGKCYAVYRNVLTYRQASHITVTFALHLTDPLARLLVPIVEEGRSARD